MVTRKAKASPPITIGVFGVGEATEKSVIKLIEDFIDGKEDVKFIFPVSVEHYTEIVGTVADWVRDEKIPYEVVMTEAAAKDRGLRSLIRDADASHKVTDVGTAIVNCVRDADDGRLLMFWDEKLVDADEDEGAYDALDYADECDVPVFDLCNALEPLSFKEPDSGDAPDDDKDDEPEPPKRGRRAAAAKDEDEDDEPAAASTKRAPVDKSLPSFEEASKLGVRALRTLARDLELDSHRAIGSMKAEQVLDLLYKGGATTPAPAAKKAADDDDDDDDAPPARSTRRTRAAKAGEPDDEPEPETAKPARRTRGAAKAESLEEEVSTAAHRVASGLPVELNPAVAVVLGQFIHLFAKEVAALVLAGLDDK